MKNTLKLGHYDFFKTPIIDFSGYVTHDSLKCHFDEYVFFRNTLKCYAIISLNKDHFKVFYDYKSYIQYFSNIKYEEFTIPNLNKQYEYVCEKIASEIKIDNKYNFYNSPRRDITAVYFKMGHSGVPFLKIRL
jgi:hypothetical protein